MPHSSGSGSINTTVIHQADVHLNQANPVQNTYYTVLDTTKNCRLIDFRALVADTGETLQGRITIDGQVLIVYAAAFNANTSKWLSLQMSQGDSNLNWAATNPRTYGEGFMLEGRSIKVEICKTTNAGNGNLKASVTYAKR